MKQIAVITSIICLLALGFHSCSEPKIEQGEIQYELTYPHMDTEGWIGIILPTEMTIIFKGTKMKTSIQKGRIFETHIISDEADQSITMYTDLDGNKMVCALTKEEIEQLKGSLPKYTLTKTTEQDSVAGLFSTKYELSSADSLQPFDAWFTESLSCQKAAWFSPYSTAAGFPLVYDIERYGIFTHAEAVTFQQKEIKDEDFIVEGEFEKVDFETYEKESQAIFEILADW